MKEISEDCLEEAFELHQIWRMDNDLCGLLSTPCRPCLASFHLPDNALSVKKELSVRRDTSGRRAGKGGAGTQRLVVLAEDWSVQRPRGGRCEKGHQLFSLARIKVL